MKLKCIIVDDEEPFIELMEIFVRVHPRLELVSSCRSANDAREILANNDIDLMFLDIEMPGLSGMDLVRSSKHLPQVIFVSSHTEFALEAFEYDVTDYIVKPPTEQRFNKAVAKAIKTFGYQALVAEKEHLYFKVDSNLVKVKFNDISCVESLGDYIKLYEGDNRHIILATMNSMQNTLGADRFMRIHRKFIVSLEAITKIDNYNVELEGGKVIQVSKPNRQNLIARLKAM